MFKQILIENFKSIHDLKINNLTPLTLIAGKNNAGKSTILEGLFFLCDFLTPQIFFKLSAFRTKQQIIGTDDLWGDLFPKDRPAQEYMQLSGMLNAKSVSVKCWQEQQNNTAFSPVQNGKPVDWALYRSDTALHYDVSCDATNLTGTYFVAQDGGIHNAIATGSFSDIGWPWTRISYVPPLRGGTLDLTDLLGEIELRNKKAELIDALQLLDPSIVDIVSVSRQSANEIFVRTDNGVLLPLALAGDGLKNLLTIVLYVMVGAPGIVLVDEIENGFHHSLYRKLWRILCELALWTPDTQIVATTHSYEFLMEATEAAVDAEAYEDFCLYRVDRDRNNTSCVRYSTEELIAADNINMEVR